MKQYNEPIQYRHRRMKNESMTTRHCVGTLIYVYKIVLKCSLFHLHMYVLIHVIIQQAFVLCIHVNVNKISLRGFQL